jgi:hypothetical protein
MTEYYTLYALQKPGELSIIDLPIQPTRLPDYRLYFPPPPRKLVDPGYSRLSIFKASYLEA